MAAAVSSLSAGRRADVSALRADLSPPIIKRYTDADLGQIPIAEATQDVLGVARRHHLVLPRELALLCKTLVMAEGLAEELDPKFQFAEVIAPQAERLIAARYSPEHLARQLRSAAPTPGIPRGCSRPPYRTAAGRTSRPGPASAC